MDVTERISPPGDTGRGRAPVRLRAEYAPLLRLALPITAGQLAAMSAAVVDNVLAGHLGPVTLGAVAVGGSLYVLMLVAVIGVMMSLQPTVAALDGAGRRADAAPLFRQSILLGLATGALGAPALATLGPATLRAAGVSSALLPGASDFLHAVACGGPAIGLFAAARGLSEGLSRTAPTLVVQLGGVAVLAPLGWALMYGRLGAPALGPLGSGIATAVAAWLQGLAYILYVRRAPAYAGMRWHEGTWRPDPSQLAPLLRIGLPISFSLLLEVGMFSAAGLVVGSLGPAAMAANQVALNIASVVFMLPLGIGLATTVRIGRAVGAGDRAAVRRTAAAALTLVLATQAASACLLLLLPRTLVSLYTDDPAVIALAAALLAYAALFQFPDGIQALANGALRGLKDTRGPMIITAVSYWLIGMPIGATLALRAHWGAAGMWAGMIAGLTPAAFLLTGRFLALVRQRGAAP